VTTESVRRITEQAVEIARANAQFQRRSIKLTGTPKVVAKWKSAFEKDPFDISTDPKVEFLLKMNEAGMKASGASFVTSGLTFQNEQKFYASTDGSRIEQYIIRTVPSFSVTAVDRAAGDFQSRGTLRGPQNIGFEYLEKYPWVKEAEQAGEEAVEKAEGQTSGTWEIRFSAPSFASLANGSRIGWAPHGVGPRAALGSELCRHKFSDAGQKRPASARLQNL